MNQDEKIWYVVYTRPRWEKKVSGILFQKGIEHYCPLNRVVKKWSDRKKIVLEPLFRGYLFIKIGEALKWEIKKIDGILNYVYWLGKPAKVNESEIDTIKKFLHEFSNIEVEERTLNLNGEVLIKQGVMMNYRGLVVEVMGNRARVKVDSMGIRLIAFFDKKNLEPVNSLNNL